MKALALILMLCAPGQDAVPDAAWRESVLRPYRQGLLVDAQKALGRLPNDATAADQGWARNMMGNLGYERGEFEAARIHYSMAVTVLETAGPAGAADLAMARSNLAMAIEREARAASLADELAGLRAVTWLAGLAALVLVALLGRRS